MARSEPGKEARHRQSEHPNTKLARQAYERACARTSNKEEAVRSATADLEAARDMEAEALRTLHANEAADQARRREV